MVAVRRGKARVGGCAVIVARREKAVTLKGFEIKVLGRKCDYGGVFAVGVFYLAVDRHNGNYSENAVSPCGGY